MNPSDASSRQAWVGFALGLVGLVAQGDLQAGAPAQAPATALADSRYVRDHAETRGFMLGRPAQETPTPDGRAVLFLRARPRVPKLELYEFDTATATTRLLLSPEQVLQGSEERLSPEEKARRERMRVSVGGFTSFELARDGSRILLSLSGRLYVQERASGAVRQLTTGAGTLLDPKLSPDGRQVAYVLDQDVYALDLASGSERRLTRGGTELLTHGLAEFVAQEEMGRFSGFWWSPDSRFLAYEEADAAGVEVWHVADPARPESPPQSTYYPRPGKANVRVRLGVIPAAGGETVWVEWDREGYPYLATVRWEEEGPLTLAVQRRNQTELQLLEADPSTGLTRVLLTERDPAWVNLHQEVPRWLPGNRGFLWISEAAGGPRLEWRERDGALRRVSVPAGEGLQELLDFDPNTSRLWYVASRDPTESHVFCVGLEDGVSEALTRGQGLHGVRFAKDHSVYVRRSVGLRAMPRLTVHAADGRELGVLPSVAEEPPIRPTTELVTIRSGSLAFHASITRPRAFSARRRYPVIVDVYGGPMAKTVTAAMNGCLMKQWLADQGFVVVSIDGRGTPDRGRDWERAILHRFGSVPLEDQVAGLRALGQRYRELDLDRVGITGWSFGGYLSALAVLRRPDVFRAGVAGAPVVDWLDYDTHYTERYLGMPEAQPEAYREGSLLSYADGLQRPLLLIHGTADDNVYFRHTLKLADALFRAGREFQLLPLPGSTHMTPDATVTEQRWLRVARFFHEHLGARGKTAGTARN